MRNRILSLVGIGLLASTFAAAQASRTWVSGVGDDANPCSRTAPCKTFAGAISKTAAGGEIDALDPGGFGAVTITKSITIDGGGGQVASVLAAGTNAINIQAGASDVVTLRNLRLQGLAQSVSGGPNGINFIAGKMLIVENCEIMNFTNNGIWAQASNGQLIVRNTTSTGNSRAGIEVDAGTAAIEDANVSGNAYGLLVFSSKVTAVRTTAGQNSVFGLTAGSGELNVADSTTTNNANGIGSSGIVRISNVTITDNSAGIATSGGGQVISWGNNHIAGNGAPSAPTTTVTPQ